MPAGSDEPVFRLAIIEDESRSAVAVALDVDEDTIQALMVRIRADKQCTSPPIRMHASYQACMQRTVGGDLSGCCMQHGLTCLLG